jgi:asparagine synthase (glutamine-hydrolysing)
MCGIFGAIDLRGRREFPRRCLVAMGAAIAHRGPDEDGVHREPGIALGARRLALVDPAHGQQPVTDGERFVAVVNGELFDHVAERARLAARGAAFRSRCDSEVWVHAFADEGDDYLPRARGQFALAMWDRRDHRLVLARDRFGICPLYTAEADGWLVFASEIKALFASELVRAELDPRAIDHVFACLCASPVRSAFAGITPVPPGHRLVARAGERPGLARFAGVDFPQRGWERKGNDYAIADELERALAASVDRRLAADAPVATYLSGGVDSSLIVALAARRGDVTAFSVALDGVGPDEAKLAARTAQFVGADHVVVSVDAAAIGALFPEVVIAAEAPILDHASCALLALSREVRARGFKAVLTGEGADEAFAGYPWTTIAHRGGAVARVAGRGFGAFLGGGGARLTTSGPFASTGAAQLYELTSRSRAFLYASTFWERLGTSSPGDDHIWDAHTAGWHPLHQSLYADYECVLAGHLLADKGDRVAMASGVEPRFPYLDEEVVALAASLDPNLKIRRGRDKWILREVARRHVPPETAVREKLMFRAEPVIHAVGRPAWVDELLSPPSLRATGLFDPAKVARALADRGMPSHHPRASLLQGGLTGVVSTQLLAHLFCDAALCSLPAWTPPG